MVGGGDKEASNETWPAISQSERTLYEILFYSQGPVGGYILGEGVRDLLLKSGLSLTVLSQIWNLADVTHDNVLNVHEFSLVMHLTRGRMAGLIVPPTLPRCLTPPKVQPMTPPPMSQQEKDAYLRVFQALDVKRTGFIDAHVAMALLRSSGLSVDVITSIWDVADFGRDGRLNPDELAIAIHLVRHVNSGGSLEGPVDIFQYAPQHTSPISLLARKRRVAEYQEHKQRLMSLKETRKQQETREAKRLEIAKNKIKCLEELAALLRKLDKPDIVEGAKIDQALNQDREEVKKHEEIVFRLKKEHEKVRQETVKIILGEQVFNEDIRIIKAETDELNKRLMTSHSHATKDPDPFHQLYEQRKEKRQGSTIKDLDKIDIHIPFEFSPFDLEVTPDTLPSGVRILQETEVKGGGDAGSDVLSVIADVKGFGEEFMQDWGGLTTATSAAAAASSSSTTTTASASTTLSSSLSSSASSSNPQSAAMSSSSTVLSLSSQRKECDDDEIFMEVEETPDPWPLSDGSNDCLLGLTDDQVVSLKAKLNDLRNELKQLNTDHRKLIFRNPEDYLARQKAKEAEEVSDRGRFNRRSATERLRNSSASSSTLSKRDGSGSGVRYRITSERSTSEAAQAARDYRLKRRSQNLDSTSASTASSPESFRNSTPNQESSSHKRPAPSPLGSPSVSDDASLSRQSSLSSTDKPATSASLNATQPQAPSLKSDKIEEENHRWSSQSDRDTTDKGAGHTAPSTPATSGDSSVLTLKSSRRKDELSLALGATALGRQITVEPTPPPVSTRTKQSETVPEKSQNSYAPADDGKLQIKDLSNGDLRKTNQPSTIPRGSSKKSRAPLPPPASPAGNSVDPPVLTNALIQPSVVSPVCSSTPPKTASAVLESDTINQNYSRNSLNESEATSPKTLTKDTVDGKNDHVSLPKRPPRIKKLSSSVSSTCEDSFDKEQNSPKQTDQKVVDLIPTQDTMSQVNVARTQAAPKLQKPSTKKRPAPSPFPPPQINEAEVIRNQSITVENKPPKPLESKTFVSEDPFNPVDNLHKLPPVSVSMTPIPQNELGISTVSADTLSVDREENDASPTPPPLPASPPPLPSACPPLMQEDFDLEEEIVTVEYSSPVNLSISALNPPSMRLNRDMDISPSLSPSATVSGSSTTGMDVTPTSNRGRAQGMRSFFEDFNSSSEEPISVSSSGLGFGSDQHSELNGDVSQNRVDSSDNDSDLTDSEGEDQKGKYEIFSPGDSGILTSSIATTPDESDTNIELVNYTPYNNEDTFTNNNYITTNYNFVSRNNNNNNNNNINVSNNVATTSENTNGLVSLSFSTYPTSSSAHSVTSALEISSDAHSSPPSSLSPASPTPPIVSEEIIVKSIKQPPQMAPLKRSPPPPPVHSLFQDSKDSISDSIHHSQKVDGNNSSIPNTNSDTKYTEDDDSTFHSSLPKWSSKSEDKVLSPRSQDIMSKARHFADMVTPKQTVVLRSDQSKETTLEEAAKQRQNIISQATHRRKTDSGGVSAPQKKEQHDQPPQQQQAVVPKLPVREDEDAELDEDDEVKSSSSNPSDYGYTYLTPREQPPPEVGWKDREDGKGVVNLYSKNVVKEVETTESVDRESIANLSTTKQQWESIFTSNLTSPEDPNGKKKAAPKWEVKLAGSIRGGDRSNANAGVKVDTGGNSPGHFIQSEISSPVMEVVNNNNNEKEDFVDGNHNNGRTNGESAIEYEIRIAREREEMLRKEKEIRDKSLTQSSMTSSSAPLSSTQKSSGPMTVLSSMEVVNGESESYQPAYNELAEADRAPDVWSLDSGVVRSEDRYENKEIDPNESIIEREIRHQKEKEAELERQRLMLGQGLPLSPSSSSISSSQPQQQQEGDSVQILSGNHSPSSGRMSPIQPVSARFNETPPSQSQESIIARELRELQEREEEMKSLRNSMHGVSIQKTNSPSAEQPSPNQQLPPSKTLSLNVTAESNGQKPSLLSPSQISPNSQGTWQREVSPFVSQKRRVSQDSASSHSMGKASSDTTATTPSRSVSVQPIADGIEGSDEDEKPDYFKKQETPIEREMRIAKERENELRRMKGMPELSNKDDYYGSYGAIPEKGNKGNGSQTKHVGYQAPSQQTMKKVSTSRLQQEIQAQKDRENLLRNEGKVISDSGEQMKPSKYMEVTGSQTVDGSEKRNFVTKRSSISNSPAQVAEIQKNLNTTQQSSKVSTPTTPVQGGSKKGLGGGSQNFSYKEFRQTAESKIERELREMREREEELKNQRKASVPQTPR